jgi:hypothetical protein
VGSAGAMVSNGNSTLWGGVGMAGNPTINVAAGRLSIPLASGSVITKIGSGTLAIGDYDSDIVVSAGRLELGEMMGGIINAATVANAGPMGAFGPDAGYTQTSSGTLLLRIDGSNCDALSSWSEVWLHGTLDVVVDGASPQLSDSYAVLYGGEGIFGTFDTLDLPTLDSGLYWDTSDLYTGGYISVTDTAPMAPAFLAVPEPASLGLLMTGAVAFGSRRRRR